MPCAPSPDPSLNLPADLPAGSLVAAAVSGGADSVALADLLAGSGRCRLIVWHLDHGLRPSSAAEAEAVVRLAGRLGVEAVVERIDVAAEAGRGEGIEAAGRRVRYARLTALCLARGAIAACTAHHRDDQAETVLMQVLRGCGPSGPPGIPAERPLAPGIRLLRPLLSASRSALRAHCQRRGLPWSEDSSNADVRWRRNFIRHAVLAGWEERFPGISADLAGLAGTSRAARTATEHQVAAVDLGMGRLGVAEAQALSTDVRGTLWRRLGDTLGIELDRGRIRRLDDLLFGAPGRRLRIGRWLLLRRGRVLVWQDAPWVDQRG